jgi:hypothetical protein
MTFDIISNIINRQQTEIPPCIDDQDIRSIRIVECNDPLVDINTCGSSYVRMLPIPTVPFSGMEYSVGLPHSTFVRKMLLTRLEAAVKNIRMILNRPELVFLVVEGLRVRDETSPDLFNSHKVTGGCVNFRVFDDEISEFVDMCDYEVLTFSNALTSEQRSNRTALLTACCMAGLINYPHEWWTFCFGTQYFCYYTKNSVAIFDEKVV